MVRGWVTLQPSHLPVYLPRVGLNSCRPCLCIFMARDSSLNISRKPPLHAFIDTASLPFAVLGPVDLSQGFQRRIISDCLCLRSKLQPVAMGLLQ